ncbi:MAG: HlyD family efflux transporter periplasmic adaptor subunit [Burkholderiales bacterium]|nr:MAG: HlyD family efflux transporter periplasmic adaptor subunit [Burkholderiales bacterium]
MQQDSFFRTEVMAAAGQRAYGSIHLASPVALIWLIAASLLIGAAVMAYIAWGSYTRKVQVMGVLVPSQGVLKLASPQSGVLTQIRVSEGQSVKAGEVLFEISAQRNLEAAESVEQQTAFQIGRKKRSLENERSQQLQLLQEQQNGLERRSGSLQNELLQIEQELITQQNRLSISEQNLKRHEGLVAQDFVSPAQLMQHQSDQLEQKTRLQQLQRSRTTVTRELANTQAELKQIPLRMQAQLGALERSLAGLVQESAENEARQSVQVRAQQDGLITGLTVSSGAVIGAGAPLATLVPQNHGLQAHLFAPSQAVGFIEPGQNVMLRYAAYPFQKFGHQEGRVIAVSKTSMTPAEATAASGAAAHVTSGQPSNEPLYRVTVQLAQSHILAYGKAQPLVAGMALDAAILQERRKLWEWVLEPLYSITGKV